MNSDTTVASFPRDLSRCGETQVTELPKLALICDFLEEGWPSMDLFGDMLFRSFQADYSSVLEVQQLRPALRYRFSKMPGAGRAGVFWNADRLLNRFHDYPVWLRKRAAGFGLFHLMDHSYSQLLLDLPAGRGVVTCHDLDTFNCLLDPESDPRPRWFRIMAQRTLNGFLKAAHVICVSAFTRANVLRHGLFPPERLSVIHPGADPVFFSAPDPSAEASSVLGSAGSNYLLHVGSTIRRKRIDLLLRIFGIVSRELPDFRLVRVGGPLTSDQALLASRLGLDDKIIHAPSLTKAQVAGLYRNAALVLQTSDAEGFGLPVAEALACGCPVVSSDIAPLREAGGVAAEYCPVGEIEAWRETVIRLLRERDGSPEAWELRRAQARRHASGYTWTQNAKQTISVYERVRNGGGSPLPF
jgi:glycosyltransferase involved in cell wall biosynthesis